MEIRSIQMYGHVGKAFTHWRYWSWRLIAEKMLKRCQKDAVSSPHAYTSTTTTKISWSVYGLHSCFLNSDAEDHDPEKCEHANSNAVQITWRRCCSKMTWNWICSNVDDQLKATLKDHPTHKASHQVFIADNTIQWWLEVILCRWSTHNFIKWSS